MKIRFNILRVVPVLAVILAVSQASGSSITWNVAGGGNWDDSTANWIGDAATFTDDGTVDVTFNNAAGGTITISPNMSPQSTTVSASSGTYTFTGGPIDSGTLTKSGGGELSMGPSAANTYAGKTVITGGQVTVKTNFYAGVAGPLGAPTGSDAVIDMYTGTTFLLASPGGISNRSKYWTTDRTINLAGTGSGTITLKNSFNDEWARFGAITGSGTGPRTLALTVVGDRGRIAVNGPVADTSDNEVSLEVSFSAQTAGDGRLYLEGTNTFSGPITINSNTKLNPYKVFINGGGQLGSGSYTNTISIGINSIFDYASSATQQLSGAISGIGSLMTSGTGSLTLLAENTYGGGTTINNGTLYAGASGSLGTGDVTVASAGLLVMAENNAMTSSATLTVPNDTTQTLTMNNTRCEVAALIINSVAQSNGTYYASVNDWMGGNGRLFVGVPAPAAGTVVLLY